MKKVVAAKLYEKCVQIYVADGQSGVIEYCREISHPTWGWCEPCDYYSPIVNYCSMTCLVCGHSTHLKVR